MNESYLTIILFASERYWYLSYDDCLFVVECWSTAIVSNHTAHYCRLWLNEVLMRHHHRSNRIDKLILTANQYCWTICEVKSFAIHDVTGYGCSCWIECCFLFVFFGLRWTSVSLRGSQLRGNELPNTHRNYNTSSARSEISGITAHGEHCFV